MSLDNLIKTNLKYNIYDDIRKVNLKTNFKYIIYFKLPELFKFQKNTKSDIISFLNEIGINSINKNSDDSLLGSLVLFYGFKKLDSTSFKIDTDKFNISSFNLHEPKRFTFDDTLKITFREFEGSPVLKTLNSWQLMVYDPIQDAVGLRKDFIGQLYKIELKSGINDINTLGTILENALTNTTNEYIDRVIKYGNVFPQIIPDPGVNNESFELININTTFALERVLANSYYTFSEIQK